MSMRSAAQERDGFRPMCLTKPSLSARIPMEAAAAMSTTLFARTTKRARQSDFVVPSDVIG